MPFSNNLFRLVRVPLSVTLGTVCTLTLILVEPIQSNLDSKLPECKKSNIQSSNSTNFSVVTAESGLSYAEIAPIEQASSLTSVAVHHCNRSSKAIQANSGKAEKPIEPEVETRQKQEQQESANEREKINFSSSHIQSSNSSKVSAIATESALIESKKALIDQEPNVASVAALHHSKETQPVPTDSQEIEEPIEPEMETKKQSGQLSYVERTPIDQEPSVSSAAALHHSNETQPVQTDSQELEKPIEPEVETKKQSGQLNYVETAPIEQGLTVASVGPHHHRKETQLVQTDSQESEEPIEQKVETRQEPEQLSYIERTSIEQGLSVASVGPHYHRKKTQLVQTDSQESEEPIEQKVETREEPEQQESPNHQQRVNLTLSDTVNLALQNNRTIKNNYLQRIIDKQELAVAEDEFVPNFTPELFLGFNQRLQRDRQELSLSGDLEVKTPIGGTLGVTSDNLGQGIGINELDFRVTLDQPLLRGFGVDVNLAPIEIARLEETVNLLTLKSTLIDTITDAIEAYLSLLQAQEQIKIEQLALENAKRRLEIIQALIDAGRRARVELVQSETNVANREVSLVAAQNRLAQARLDLIEILDIERNLELVATDIENAAASISLDSDKVTQLAFANNPEYLQSLKRLEIAKFNLLLAENEKLWGLDLQVSYGFTRRKDVDDQTDVRAGIILSREFGNLNLEQSVERSQVRLEQANNNLDEVNESLQIEINNRIRDVKFNLKQIELAQRARELSEQQLDNEREKLRLGVRGARLIDVLNFENDLVQAKNRELNTMIDYLRALTRLEQTVGITLDRWNIEIDNTALLKKD